MKRKARGAAEDHYIQTPIDTDQSSTEDILDAMSEVGDISEVIDDFSNNECYKHQIGNSLIEIVLGEKQMRPKLPSYPLSCFGKKETRRAFTNGMYERFDWLECCVEKDIALCNPCRRFKVSISEKTGYFGTDYKVFAKYGFNNWKKALDKGQGLYKQAASVHHIEAVKVWRESIHREENDTRIINLLPHEEDHKTWLESVFLITKFLATNGEPFRGSTENAMFCGSECDTDSETENDDEFTGEQNLRPKGGGLFLNLYEDLLFKIQPELREIARNLPKNAKYCSPSFQNEVIELLDYILTTKIVADIKQAKLFTLMVDGTTDKNGKEIEGIVLRYLSSSGVEEHALTFFHESDRSARGVFDAVKNTLGQHDISFDGLVSNIFDGASVKSGFKGGVQAHIQNYCQRNVVYVNCVNHRIHLVVMSIMKNVPAVEDFFSLIMSLYTLFKVDSIRRIYNGRTLKKLITTRWSGHLNALNVVSPEYTEIRRTLNIAVTSIDVKSQHRIIAKSNLTLLNQNDTKFLLMFLLDVLMPINILTLLFQSPTFDSSSVISTIASVQQEIFSLKEKINEEFVKEKISKVYDDHWRRNV